MIPLLVPIGLGLIGGYLSKDAVELFATGGEVDGDVIGKVKSKDSISLIIEGAKLGTRKIKITWFPAYNEKEHGMLSEELKKRLKEGKIDYIDIIEDDTDFFIKNSEIQKLEWVKDGTNTTFDANNPDIRYELGGIFHGSPYKFKKFSTNNILTGEGQNVFGWGLYFTSLEDIAKNYSDNESLLEKHLSRIYTIIPDRFYQIPKEFTNSKEKAIKYIDKQIEGWKSSPYQQQEWKKLRDAISSYKAYVYDVTLFKNKTPDQYNWLEWHKPVSIDNLIKIFSGAEKLGGIPFKDGWELDEDGLTNERANKVTGQELYWYLEKYFNSNKEASLFLLSSGIDGIKYPAETIIKGISDNPRGFNYVVFDENAVTIENIKEYKKGGKISDKLQAPKGYCFVTVGSHRALDKIDRYGVKFISLYKIGGSQSGAGKSVLFMSVDDYERIKNITGVAGKESLKADAHWFSRKENDKIQAVFKTIEQKF